MSGTAAVFFGTVGFGEKIKLRNDVAICAAIDGLAWGFLAWFAKRVWKSV